MTDEADLAYEHGKRTRKCAACPALIIFLPTEKGRSMPCEAATVAPEDTKYIHGKHISHFANCPAHEKFRRGGSHQ